VLTLFDKSRIEAQLHIAGNFTTDQFAIENHDGNAFITLDPSRPVSADQAIDGADGLTVDKQVGQLVSSIATHSANDSGFNSTTLPIQAQHDSNLQSTLASAS
jgi:hypothetical protein